MTTTKLALGSPSSLRLQQAILLCLAFMYPIQGNTDVIKRLGDAYVIYLPGKLNFDEVVTDVKSEAIGVNWQVVNELNIGATVKELGIQIENRVISVCNIQYLAQAIEEDPFISLIIPCRFTVFRETNKKTGKKRIVVGFYDPVAEAAGLNLKQAHAAAIATKELKAVLQRIAELYQE